MFLNFNFKILIFTVSLNCFLAQALALANTNTNTNFQRGANIRRNKQRHNGTSGHASSRDVEVGVGVTEMSPKSKFSRTMPFSVDFDQTPWINEDEKPSGWNGRRGEQIANYKNPNQSESDQFYPMQTLSSEDQDELFFHSSTTTEKSRSAKVPMHSSQPQGSKITFGGDHDHSSNPLLDTYPYFKNLENSGTYTAYPHPAKVKTKTKTTKNKVKGITKSERTPKVLPQPQYDSSASSKQDSNWLGDDLSSFNWDSFLNDFNKISKSGHGHGHGHDHDHDHHSHSHGWGWKEKDVYEKVINYVDLDDTNLLGFFGLLILLSLISNALLAAYYATTTAAARRKRSAEAELSEMGSHELKRQRIFYEILPLLTPIAHVRSGKLSLECALKGVCQTNRILVKEYGSFGHSVGVRVTAAVSKLLSDVENKSGQQKKIASAGVHGRKLKNCATEFNVCKHPNRESASKLPFKIRLEDVPKLIGKLKKKMPNNPLLLRL